jgi:hypothetical protein
MTDNRLELLKSEIKKRISGIDSSRVYYRDRSFGFYISITILSALTTILLGSDFDDPDVQSWLKRLALILTALITVVSSYNAFFNHKDLWIANNQALNRLKELSFNVSFREAEPRPLSEDEIEKFRANYQTILDELNNTWANSRAAK